MAAPIRTAVIGTGMSATVFHIPFILSLPSLFSLHAVVERSATPTKSIARDRYGSRVPDLKVVNTLDEVLNDGEVKLVVISTPNSTHFPYAKAALEAGKNVIIEKPLVPTSAEADILISLAKAHNLVLATYQNRRWDSDFLTLRRLLEVENVFGELSEFETRYDRWKPTLKGNGTWKEEVAWGNGAVFDLGSHLIDQVLTLFGTPATISAHVSNSRAAGPEKLHDAFIAHFFYPPSSPLRPNTTLPLTVTLRSASLSLLDPQLRFSVKGTNASFLKYGLDVQEDQLKLDPPLSTDDAKFGVEEEKFEGTLSTVDANGKIVTTRVPTEKGQYIEWFTNVGEAIQAADPTKLIVQPEQARNAIRAIELIYASHEQGKVLSWSDSDA